MMKLLCAIFLVLPIVSYAQDTEDNREDHEALRALRNIYETAASQNKLELLEPYIHSNFSAVMMTNRQFYDFQKLKEQWTISRNRFVGNGTYEIKLEPELSEIYGDLAIAKGDSLNKIIKEDGETITFKAKWSAVLKKESGQWKIIRGHTSLDPFRNPFVIAETKKIVVKTAAWCLLIGAFVGFVIAFVSQKLRKKAAL